MVGMVIVSGCETRTEAVIAWLKDACVVRARTVNDGPYVASYAIIAFEIWKARAHWSDLAMT